MHDGDKKSYLRNAKSPNLSNATHVSRSYQTQSTRHLRHSHNSFIPTFCLELDNMVHTKSSKRTPPGDDSASSKEKLGTSATKNGSYMDPPGQRKSKRFKNAAESEFPPHCALQLRSRTIQKEFQIETYENKNVSDDCVPSSEAEVEFISGEDMGERDRLKSVDEKLCNDMDLGVTEEAESHLVNMQEPMKDRNLPENTSELNMAKVQPQSISLPEGEVLGCCRQSITGTKQFSGTTYSVLRDISPNMGRFSNSGTVKVAISMEEKTFVLEKSDSGDHFLLELGESTATVPKPIDVAGRVNTKEMVAMPLPLKPSKEMNGDNAEGSTSKNSEMVIPNNEILARNHRLINGERPSASSSGDSARSRVKETLRYFRGVRRKILQDEEARPRKRDGRKFRVDCEASKILKSQGLHLNSGTQIIGTVPGVEVGDEFRYRMELKILGIHRQTQTAIDYMKDDSEELVAMSIVSYDDVLDYSDVLIYTGQGGNVGNGKKKTEDQQLVKGNLALKNSIRKKNPVRVIRGSKNTTSDSSADAENHVYDGLYLVEAFWKESWSRGKAVFKFKLRRIPGQPELSWNVVKKSNISKFKDGLCNVDISEGKEEFPICAVNELDDEKPPPFIYTVRMIYPDWCLPLAPKSCGCKKRCSESENCACITKNGGELPYNHDGAIVEGKEMVYECGPHCTCPPSCYMRVTQRGIKFQLEIFKTESRGWGVRSLNSIPSGSFICEYTGEVIEDKEAERLTGKDEYLFDIGEKDRFTIDAARKGNIGRFINHCCSPNLYAQEVLYDHEDTRIPHVIFFAEKNIPPLEELTYDYNYAIGQVIDANGNTKKKNCYCGSNKCTGRLY